MFEQAFKTQLSLLTNDDTLVEKLWGEIKTGYSKKSRHYHNLSHLDNLLAELLPLQDTIQDWQTLLFSMAYHDIIYNTLKNDNEQKSAELAIDRLAKLPTPLSQQEKCFAQIMATREHSLSGDNDTNLFTDADLAILGADTDRYNQYAKEIRREYRFYPDAIYKPGRQKVLQHFLAMPAVYKTSFFHEKYEAQARVNLQQEWEGLSSR
ncbi:MAG: hypothetical protein INR73_06455 [Williamsia sp.]|nr:hypothetical protein [Williamsia sp.]